MKIAVTSKGDDAASAVDPLFGRAGCFLVFDTETQQYTHLDNLQNRQSEQGAGIQAAEKISRSGAAVLITGHCGPKAFRALRAAGIEVVLGAEGSVADAVRQYQEGLLKAAEIPDVEGHWA